MSYNQEFFEQYTNYLQEPLVRHIHNWMFHIYDTTFPQWMYPFNVIDFGCGQCCEYRQHGMYCGYLGLDLNPPKQNDCFQNGCFQCDYKKVSSKTIKKKAEFIIHGFVSLFSTECCMATTEKYDFYDKIFEKYDMQMGLVSGFYYKNRIKEEKVEETGGIVSYQTIEDQKDYTPKRFIEMRTHIDVPSKMFGPDVVEVWKLLIRKPDYVN